MKVNSNVRQFKDKLKQLRGATDLPFHNILAWFMRKWLKEVAELTPVSIFERDDPGRAAGSWSISRDQPGSFSIPRGTSSSADAAIDRAADMKFANAYAIWYLYNRVPYIKQLEYGLYGNGPRTINGFSTQAPAGMLRITTAELHDYLDELVSNV